MYCNFDHIFLTDFDENLFHFKGRKFASNAQLFEFLIIATQGKTSY